MSAYEELGMNSDGVNLSWKTRYGRSKSVQIASIQTLRLSMSKFVRSRYYSIEITYTNQNGREQTERKKLGDTELSNQAISELKAFNDEMQAVLGESRVWIYPNDDEKRFFEKQDRVVYRHVLMSDPNPLGNPFYWLFLSSILVLPLFCVIKVLFHKAYAIIGFRDGLELRGWCFKKHKIAWSQIKRISTVHVYAKGRFTALEAKISYQLGDQEKKFSISLAPESAFMLGRRLYYKGAIDYDTAVQLTSFWPRA